MMAASAWSFRARSTRKGRSFKRGHGTDCEDVKLDFSKDASENLKLVLTQIVKSDGSDKQIKLSYLNAFVKLCQKNGSLRNLNFSCQEIICCLRSALVHEAKEVRIAGIRALRYFLQDDESIDAFTALQVDFLICRSIDIVLDNQIERVHALKLVRKILNISPNKVTFALTRCIVSLANDEPSGQEKLVRACLCIISELAVANTALCADCNGLNTLLNKAVDIQQPWINEAMIGVILYLLNNSETRRYIRKYVRVEQIVAPFSDLHYRHSIESNESNFSDERQAQLQASKLALLSTFRSWSGLIWLSQPSSDSGLKSVINALYLEYSEIQNEVMDMMFDLFRIPLPKWTSDFSTAILSIDPSTPKDSWELYEGFVAEEGKDILPNQSKYRLNIVDNYLALLLFAFVNAGVLNALVEVITKTSSKQMSVRATILLAELLNLTSLLLPSECSRHCQALPKLLTMATSLDIPKQHRHQAGITVSNLSMIHKLKKRGPVPSSLFLDQQIRFCSVSSQNSRKFSIGDLISRTKLESCVRTSDDLINQAIKDSCVLTNNDCTNWDWNIISSCIFKLVTDTFRRLEDVNHKLFVRRIVNFFKPCSRLFCSMALTKENSLQYSSTGIHLIEFLLDADEGDGGRMHEEWMRDIADYLAEVKQSSLSSDAVFSPHKLARTLAQHYFLFFGKLSSSSKGCKVLERSGIFQILLELIDENCHGCYTKLIVSCLDYTKPVLSRILLNKILTSSYEESRLYGANILLVLLRAKLPDFHKWVIELLVTQLYDKSRIVSLRALAILDEACNEPVNLEALIQMRPSFLHLGDDGLLLLVRFLSSPAGFKFLSDANFIQHELQKWETGFLLRYVDIVESKLNQALTRHQTDENGVYGRRDSEKHTIGDIFLPPHLYGQLAQHDEGFNMLLEQTDYLQKLLLTIQQMKVDTEKQIAELKAAIWALGHVGTSISGITFLNHREIIPDIVKLAEECAIFSVRGTCFYVIGLLSSTSIGSNLLSQVGWQSKRQHRLEKWPVIIQRHHFDNDLAEEYLRHYSSSSCDSRGDNDFALCNVDSNNVSSSAWQQYSNMHRTSSTSEQTINYEQKRNRSTSSGCQLTNSGQWSTTHSNSVCFSDRNSVNEHEFDSFQPKEENGQFLQPHSSNIHTNHHSSGSCKVLHVRQSSTSFLHIENDQTDPTVTSTKERSRSLTESKTESKSNAIVKVDSDTKLQQMTKPDKDWLSPSSPNIVDGMGESTESESQSNKNRSDSYADSTTSGVSSCESVGMKNSHVVVTPVSSSTVFDSSSFQLNQDLSNLTLDNNIEYLDTVRKRVQLRNTPNLIRHLSNANQIFKSTPPDTTSMTSSISLDNSIFNFMSSKDAIGYETLKSLQRSPGLDNSSYHSQFNLHNARSSRSFYWKKTKSLEESVGSSRRSTTSSSTTAPEITSDAEVARYMGVCLPIDPLMIFSIYDENDTDDFFESFPDHSNNQEDDGLTYHSLKNCLSCHKCMRTETSEVTTNPKAVSLSDDVIREHHSQANKKLSPSVATPGTSLASLAGSCTSSSSVDLCASIGHHEQYKLATIRREVIRIVMNLSSSVAVKSAEQSLLNMKQKYPIVFQDTCLYSEVCHLMALYRFRFSARKFLQEFFQDLQFDTLLEDAEEIINQK